ncbi:MAG TPA: cysteine dioxygenase family protein [Candidatus Stackebrandtia faecavium]|nr:cysteine dioxygenase family protein [Candidatus Stackebrandtia faecavium]
MTKTTPISRLSELASSYAATIDGPFKFRSKSRSAHKLHSTDDFEVWLLAWLPGQSTDLHDHGGDAAPAPSAFTMISGELTEYTVSPGFPPTLNRQVLGTGETSVVDSQTVHAVKNRGDRPAVSVHVYAPALTLMRRYLFDESGLWLAALRRAGEDW